MTAPSQRYVTNSGPYWGAEFDELCRGHRLYVLRLNADPSEQIDLYTDPNGNNADKPVSVQECYLCRRDADEFGHGLHGVSARYGCPNCGSDIERKQERGGGSVVNYNRCYTCRPPFPTLGKPIRAIGRLLGVDQ